jgi:signal transduction histidine kinase
MATMDQRTVLLVSDDAEFLRQLSDRWQGERIVPAFLVAAGAEALRANFDLAIVGCETTGVSTRVATDGLTKEHVGTDALVCPAERSPASLSKQQALRSKLRELEKAARPIFAVAPDQEALRILRRDFPRVLAIAFHENWADTLVFLAVETLRRIDAVKRAERAEQLNLVLRRNATLGQYVIDMRHSLNNALTSVLGNAELLLLEPGAFSADLRSQLDTIRHMSLRMHEIIQRFSSLEKELTFAEKQERQPRNETGPRQVAAAQSGL